jgi:hypothetical protein
MYYPNRALQTLDLILRMVSKIEPISSSDYDPKIWGRNLSEYFFACASISSTLSLPFSNVPSTIVVCRQPEWDKMGDLLRDT